MDTFSLPKRFPRALKMCQKESHLVLSNVCECDYCSLLTQAGQRPELRMVLSDSGLVQGSEFKEFLYLPPGEKISEWNDCFSRLLQMMMDHGSGSVAFTYLESKRGECASMDEFIRSVGMDELAQFGKAMTRLYALHDLKGEVRFLAQYWMFMVEPAVFIRYYRSLGYFGF